MARAGSSALSLPFARGAQGREGLPYSSLCSELCSQAPTTHAIRHPHGCEPISVMGRHGTFRVSQGEAACGGDGRTRENEFPLASAHCRRPGHPALARRLPRAVLQTISCQRICSTTTQQRPPPSRRTTWMRAPSRQPSRRPAFVGPHDSLKRLKNSPATTSPALSARATRPRQRIRGVLWGRVSPVASVHSRARLQCLARHLVRQGQQLSPIQATVVRLSTTTSSRPGRRSTRPTGTAKRPPLARRSFGGARPRGCGSCDRRMLGGAPPRATQNSRKCSTPSVCRRMRPRFSTAST